MKNEEKIILRHEDSNLLFKTYNANGITLVALVITIIVLLILAGVSIVTLFGENGIINKARGAAEKQKIAYYEEIINQAILEARTNCITENREDEVLTETKKILESNQAFSESSFSEITNKQFTITTQEGFVFTVTENGVSYLENGKTENLNVRTSVTIGDYNEDYGCVYSATINVTTGYLNMWDYYIRAKADLLTKERLFYIAYSSYNNDLLALLEELKANDLTLSEYCKKYGST